MYICTIPSCLYIKHTSVALLHVAVQHTAPLLCFNVLIYYISAYNAYNINHKPYTNIPIYHMCAYIIIAMHCMHTSYASIVGLIRIAMQRCAHTYAQHRMCMQTCMEPNHTTKTTWFITSHTHSMQCAKLYAMYACVGTATLIYVLRAYRRVRPQQQ